MKGMGRLVKNEIIKLWKQKGYKIIVFIILGFMVLTPLFNMLISNAEYTAEDEYEDAVYWAELYEDSEPLESKYYAATAEAYKFFIDNELGESWKYEVYGADYVNEYIYVSGIELIKEGKYSEEEVCSSFYISIDDGIDVKTEYEFAKKRLETLENDILSVTPQKYYQQYILFCKATVTTSEEELSKAKAKHESDPDNGQLESAYEYAKAKLDTDKIVLGAWETLYAKSVDPNGWQYTIVTMDLHDSIRNYLNNIPVSKAEYMSSYEDIFGGYDKYLETCEEGLEYYKGNISKYIFAIENDIEIKSELMIFSDVSVKSASRNMVESFISIFTVIMIIMLAGSIAKEFSSGTVRLLLIRPRTRTQIIVSKMLAVLIVFGVLTAGVTVLANLEYMLFFGVGDMFAPDILIVGENVFAVPSFIITLLTLLIATLPALAYASVAALLAALTKKSGMSITLPVLLNVIIVELIAGIASLLYMERPDIFSWIKHSPIAYFNMSFVNGTAFWSISRYANVWLGVVYHVAFITISVWLTIISYKKAQVKG